MFSREESKQIRQEFWTNFGKQSPKKWILYDTKIKEINLKFDFDTKKAMVSIDVDAYDEVIRNYYFEKLISLKSIFQDYLKEELYLDENYLTESGKTIAKSYVLLENVSIHNRKTWPEVYEFFNHNMMEFELFFMEYKDFIES